MNLEQREPRFETGFAFVDNTSTSGSEAPADTGGSREDSLRQRHTSSRAISRTTRRSKGAEERPPPVYTTEPVNLAVLRDIASRRGADKLHLSGCAASLRECIFYFLRCVSKRYGGEVGSLTVAWREASTLGELGLTTRRFSGCAPFLKEDGLDGPIDHLRQLVDEGVPKAFVGRSLFGMPRLLRHMARAGLDACDIDQVNSHFCAQAARHPSAPVLKKYIDNRTDVLHEVARAITPQPTWPLDWTAEGAAKVLFLSLGYGGAISTWCDEYHVPSGCLPAIVHEFEKEQRLLRAADAAARPELLQRARSAGKDRPDVSLQAALNLQTEREWLDVMASHVPSTAIIGSFEHDGLFIWRPPSSEAQPGWEILLKDDLNASSVVGMCVSLKAIPSKAELLDQLRALDPDGDWETVDEQWEEQLRLILQARPGSTRGREDRLYAGIVSHESTAYDDYPRPVRDMFKHDRAGTYWFFNPKVLKWEKDTEIGRNELLHVISTVLSRRLADYTTAIGEEGGEVIVQGSPPEVLNGAPLLERVEKMLRAPLKDPAFELDGEETRRWIQFTNGVFDRDTLTFVPSNPDIRVTNTTEWAWKGSGLAVETELAITSALESVAADESTEMRSGELSAATCAELDGLCANVPDLKYINCLCGTWERAIYCLKHIARATFALKYQDILVTRGPGGNGKDVLANRVATLLGTYFVNLACEALTSCRDLDSPSQTILGLRSKRFVCVREMAKNQTVRGHIYRTISDPKNKVKARGLYGKDEVFHPHYLLFACTNVPLELDDKGGGSQRRTRILDMPFNFVDEPNAPNERMKDANIEDAFESNNPSFFFLLIQILRVLLSKPANHVAPVPDEVQDAGAEELEEPWEACLHAFVQKRMAPTDKPAQASTSANVREEFFKAAAGAVQQREVRLKLARKGFHETTQAVREGLKKSTKRIYQYNFGEGGTQYVKLCGD